MGFVGLFIGPVLMALFVSMWREWVHDLDQVDDDGGAGLAVPPEVEDLRDARIDQAQKKQA